MPPQERPTTENKELIKFVGAVQWAITEISVSVDSAKRVQEDKNKWAEDALVDIKIAEKWIRNIKESLEAKKVTQGLTDQLSAEGYYDDPDIDPA